MIKEEKPKWLKTLMHRIWDDYPQFEDCGDILWEAQPMEEN